MNEENRTEEVLRRVDNYLSLMRFKYSDEEKLMRINVINDYYKTQRETPSEEVFSSTIEYAEQLSDKFILPLKVRGVFLYEGRPKKKFYTADELAKASVNPINSKFPLMLDHRDNEASTVIGMVDKIKYDDKIKGIRWWGHINDETFARNILDGAIKEVSVTVFSEGVPDDKYGIVGIDLAFKELSLVMDGAVSGNFIEVDA